MAGAEARAVWQRTANRCFVQEDAKRAPKLAYCQSSSSTTKQVDAGPATATEGLDHPGVGFMPINRNRSYSNLPPDTRWWLQMQPNYGYQKDLTYEQLNELEADMETLRAGFVEQTSKNSEFDQHKGKFTDGDCMKTGYEVQKKDVDAEYGENIQELRYKDMRETYEKMGMDTIDCPVSEQSKELSCEPEYPWMGGGRTEPWWRTTDRDELASLVAQKSLNHIENCDLPPPQKLYHKRHPYAAHIGFSDRDGILGTSLDRKAQASGFSSMTTHAGYADTGITHGKNGDAADEEHSDTSIRDLLDLQQLTEGDPTKAQLIEALCHSQTRAREAEKAAKQACAEKEHIFKLFFKQASQLFAYKQWFQLLQLETLYVQIKNKDQAGSTVLPVVLPWMSSRRRKSHRSWRKVPKGKRSRRVNPGYDISKYAVALALGFGLVGAGLLLGWTVGWMLPSF
ncbi:uncharacterized protein LOC133714349 [Rosa rugosa]|uniref:uncharacterized protein LOC133714349 n=1 Tax=Rosa rugosa TaxID=74645 RepID=UPI002B415754|nr:uncharacterized protein LOC133714349 [Rosa rugosa]